jgi:hypothetical protein
MSTVGPFRLQGSIVAGFSFTLLRVVRVNAIPSDETAPGAALEQLISDQASDRAVEDLRSDASRAIDLAGNGITMVLAASILSVKLRWAPPSPN